MSAAVSTAFLFLLRPESPGQAPWSVSDKSLVVGRADSAEACIDDEQLSRGHFMIGTQNGEFILVDLESANGTWVNGKRIAACKLRGEEIIQAGASTFRFSFAPSPTAPSSIPVHVLPKPKSATSEIRTL